MYEKAFEVLETTDRDRVHHPPGSIVVRMVIEFASHRLKAYAPLVITKEELRKAKSARALENVLCAKIGNIFCILNSDLERIKEGKHA